LQDLGQANAVLSVPAPFSEMLQKRVVYLQLLDWAMLGED